MDTGRIRARGGRSLADPVRDRLRSLSSPPTRHAPAVIGVSMTEPNYNVDRRPPRLARAAWPPTPRPTRPGPTRPSPASATRTTATFGHPDGLPGGLLPAAHGSGIRPVLHRATSAAATRPADPGASRHLHATPSSRPRARLHHRCRRSTTDRPTDAPSPTGPDADPLQQADGRQHPVQAADRRPPARRRRQPIATRTSRRAPVDVTAAPCVCYAPNSDTELLGRQT